MRFSLALFVLVATIVAISTIVTAKPDGYNTDAVDQYIRGDGHRKRELERQRLSDLLRTSECEECRENGATSRSSAFDTREEIFDQLSPSEYKSLVDYATSDDGANIADTTKEGINSGDQALNRNYIVFMQLLPPPQSGSNRLSGSQDGHSPRSVCCRYGQSRPTTPERYDVLYD